MAILCIECLCVVFDTSQTPRFVLPLITLEDILSMLAGEGQRANIVAKPAAPAVTRAVRVHCASEMRASSKLV